MDRKDLTVRPEMLYTSSDFEVITRRMRWLAIFTLVFCFPFDPPRTYFAYGLAAIAIVYNLTRYSPWFLRYKWYRSPISMIITDTLFVGILILLLGTVATPFSVYLVYPIVTAAYRYKLQGTLILVILQLVWTWVMISGEWYSPLHLSGLQLAGASASVLIGLGIYVERLSHFVRAERDELELLSRAWDAQRKHLLTLVDSLQDAIFVVDAHGKVLVCNAAAEGLSNVPGDIQGKLFADVLKLYPHVNTDAKQANVLKGAEPQHRRDLCVVSDHGAVTDLDVNVQPVRLEGSNTTDFVIVCRDITKERSFDEQRSEFISVISHELRTPISIMEAALSIAELNSTKLDKETRALVEQAHQHSLYLGNIVKDLSMIAEANNDNLPVTFEEINPAELLNQLANDFKASAEQKGLQLRVEVGENLPELLSTKNHILEILQNYTTNAIKYSPSGTVVLRAEASKKGGIIFSVQDNGIGISASDQNHLFKKFFRSEDFRTRETGGTGLGLYLCMQLALRLSGKVWCQSELNQGSTFYLEIPPVSQLRRDQKEVVQAEVATLMDRI
jgi:PAS domain S-box-containing protein